MTLNELRQEVYTLTNRPTLVAETLTAIRSATLKLHQLDYFYPDLEESAVAFSAADFVQSLDYVLLIPRWRALKYARKTNSTGTELGTLFEVMSPEFVLTPYHIDRVNVCYAAGRQLQFRSSTSFQYIFLGYYVNPDVTEASYSSWIADRHPYAIVFEAAATVFKAIGDTEKFAAYTGFDRDWETRKMY